MTLFKKPRLPAPRAGEPEDRSVQEALASIRAAIHQLRFGSVSIKFHDARVVQLDITEKSLL